MKFFALKCGLSLLLSSMIILGIVFFLWQGNFSTKKNSEFNQTSIKEVQAMLTRLEYFDSDISGILDNKTISSLKRFQADNGIVADGKLTRITMAMISRSYNLLGTSRGIMVSQSENKLKYGEFIEWSEVEKIFPKGSIACVTDVRSGKKFNIKRTYGHNHADCEPATAEDTAIMKEIWGEWSWSTRAVLVEINTHTIAGSASAMPHAGLDSASANAYVKGRSAGYGAGINLDEVKNNNFDGHFDLHFLNSRTHATNKINPAHQICVKEAAGLLKRD